MRGNSAIWQHPPIGTDQSTSFLVCVWLFGAATVNAVLPEELLCITECPEIIRDPRSNDDPILVITWCEDAHAFVRTTKTATVRRGRGDWPSLDIYVK